MYINAPFHMSTKTLNIALDTSLLQKIDQAVKEEFASRSEYFRRLALADLERRERWKKLMTTGKGVGAEMGVSSEEQVYAILND